MKDIYNNRMIGTIGIYSDIEYIGEVVNKDEWNHTGRVKVYIPELLPHFNKGNLVSTKERYKVGNKVFDATTDVGILAKQATINGIWCEPQIGDNVVVRFINGDVKKAVFYMVDYTYLTDWGDIGDVSDMEE